MAAPTRINREALSAVAALGLFWLCFSQVVAARVAGAESIAVGDLVTHAGPVRTCLRVHSFDAGPGAVPYVWATAQDDARRTYHVPAAEVSKGCAP